MCPIFGFSAHKEIAKKIPLRTIIPEKSDKIILPVIYFFLSKYFSENCSTQITSICQKKVYEKSVTLQNYRDSLAICKDRPTLCCNVKQLFFVYVVCLFVVVFVWGVREYDFLL